MLGFEYRRAEKEYEFELKIRSSQIRTSFNNPKPNYNYNFWAAHENTTTQYNPKIHRVGVLKKHFF